MNLTIDGMYSQFISMWFIPFNHFIRPKIQDCQNMNENSKLMGNLWCVTIKF